MTNQPRNKLTRAEKETRARFKQVMRDLEADGVTYNYWGEDANLETMFRGEKTRCFMQDLMMPPPFRYMFKNFSSKEKIPLEIKEQLTENLGQKVEDIFAYAQNCQGLTIPVPEGYLAENDFIDIARIYLTKIFGGEGSRKVIEHVADSLEIVDDTRLRISKSIKAEVALTTYLLNQIIFEEKKADYFYVVNNELSFPIGDKLNKLGQMDPESLVTGYMTDVDVEKFEPPLGNIVLLSKLGTRMIITESLREKLFSGEVPPHKFGDLYQVHELRQKIN